MKQQDKLIVHLILSASLALILYAQFINPAIAAAFRSNESMTQYQLEIKKYDSTFGVITSVSTPNFSSEYVGDDDVPSKDIICTFTMKFSYAYKNDTIKNTFQEIFSRSEADTVTVIDKCSFVTGQKIKIFFDGKNPTNHYLENDYRHIMAVSYTTRLSNFWYVVALVAGIICLACIFWMVITIKALKKLKT